MSQGNHPLFDGLKSGNRQIIEEIYASIFPKIKHWIISHGGTSDDAYDVFQETLENILLKVKEVHTSFEGLTMQIAKHKWYDRIRKNTSRKEVRMTDEIRLSSETTIEDDFIEKEKAYLRYKLLEQSFDQLSDLCKQLMTMIKGGDKVEKIVEQMAFASANTMYRRKAACMERWCQLTREHASYKKYIS